jgi:hypothetical protein
VSGTEEVAMLLIHAIDYAAIGHPVNLRPYSGRYMYGKSCLALDGRRTDVMRVLFKAAVADGDVFEMYGLDRYLEDAMGLGIVVYWPNLDELEGFDFDS